MSFISRVRGVLGIAALWGGVGSVVGSMLGVLAGLTGVAPLGEAILSGAVGMGSLGAMLGTAFAGVLTLAEKRRTLADLTPGRAAAWGGIAGAAIPVVILLVSAGSIVGARLTLSEFLGGLLIGAATYGGLGASLAAGSVALAKRAGTALPDGDKAELDAGSGEPGPMNPSLGGGPGS